MLSSSRSRSLPVRRRHIEDFPRNGTRNFRESGTTVDPCWMIRTISSLLSESSVRWRTCSTPRIPHNDVTLHKFSLLSPPSPHCNWRALARTTHQLPPLMPTEYVRILYEEESTLTPFSITPRTMQCHLNQLHRTNYRSRGIWGVNRDTFCISTCNNNDALLELNFSFERQGKRR